MENLTPPALESPSNTSPPSGPTKSSSKVWMVLAIIFGVMLLSVVGVGIWYFYNFHAKAYDPTQLTQPEEEVLATKLEVVSGETVTVGIDAIEQPSQPVEVMVSDDGTYQRSDGKLISIYDPERRTIVFTEREINGYLGTNFEDQSRILYLDLNRDEIVAKWVVPIPEDAILFPGKTVRANLKIGAFIDQDTGRLAMMIRDVTVGGVPMPNAWLGDIKNVNVFEETPGMASEENGFLKRLADGIEDFEVRDGEIRIRLAE